MEFQNARLVGTEGQVDEEATAVYSGVSSSASPRTYQGVCAEEELTHDSITEERRACWVAEGVFMRRSEP